MRHAGGGLAFILIAILSMLCGPALARQKVAPVKRPVQVPVCDDGGELEIKLIPTRVTPLAGVLRADMLAGRWRGDDLEVDMQVENDTAQPCHVKAVRVWLGGIVKDREIRAQWLYPALARETNGAMMPPGSRAMMKLTVPGAARTGSSFLPLTMMLVGDDDKDAGGMRLEDWGMYPIYAEQIEQRRRDAEANGRISLFALLAAGVLWLANPFDEKDLDAATMWSLGGRARYEFNRYLAVEGDIALAWSKEARFNDVMQGELTRTATLGRASVGLALKLGYETIPTLRGGVGLQGVHHKAALMATPGEGPDLDFELDAVWYFGAGVDRRVTEELRVGAEVIFAWQAGEAVGKGTSAVLQAGIHAVYSWKP